MDFYHPLIFFGENVYEKLDDDNTQWDTFFKQNIIPDSWPPLFISKGTLNSLIWSTWDCWTLIKQ